MFRETGKKTMNEYPSRIILSKKTYQRVLSVGYSREMRRSSVLHWNNEHENRLHKPLVEYPPRIYATESISHVQNYDFTSTTAIYLFILCEVFLD